MNTKRLGCLSPLGLLAAVITLAVIFTLEFTSGNGLFTAGALNNQTGQVLGGVGSHAEIGRDCEKCHAPFWSADKMSDRCVVCHVTVQAEIGDTTKLHGTILTRNPRAECRSCHPEHRGPNASLTLLNEAEFPHETVGFSLAAHRRLSSGSPFTCKDCHGENITTFNPQLCSDCHHQIDAAYISAHSQNFGDNCLACHDGVDRFSRFDHSQGRFALTGKHSGVDCSSCHLNARTMLDLQNTPLACESCHLSDDAHEGQFGAQCGLCHHPNGWEEQVKFDHNLAAFKLEGKHTAVECEKCHIGGQFKGTPADCYSCHQQDDEHNGEFGSDCAACHTPASWENASVDHNLFAFKLDGAHVRVKCTDCHQNGVFKGAPQECAACHGDPAFHGGMFVGQACSACHTTTAWSPAAYNGPHPGIADEGGRGVNHGGEGCRSCHTANLNTTTCTKCHDDNNPEEEKERD